jgi:hypothetical protein
VAYGAAPGVAGKAVALVLLGAAYLLALSTFSSIAQLRSPAAMRGRSIAVNTTILGLLYPAGSLLQGKIGDRLGLNTSTVGAGVVMLAIMAAVRVLRPQVAQPLDVPVAAPVLTSP